MDRLTLLRAVVDELVEAEEVWLRSTVNVVPPETCIVCGSLISC